MTSHFKRFSLYLVGSALVGLVALPSLAQAMDKKPVLTITSKPSSSVPAESQPVYVRPTYAAPARVVPQVPDHVTSSVSSVIANPSSLYSRPSQAPVITADQVLGSDYFQGDNSVVSEKVGSINQDFSQLKTRVNRLSEQLRGLETQGRNKAAEYYASIATINTQLQTGTTPGNPRLIQKLNTAQKNLDALDGNIAELNSLGVEVADTASKTSYLLDTVRSTYNVSGAVEEDHVKLAQIEDQIANLVVIIERLLNEINDDLSRTNTYVSTERSNLRTLALAVSNGDLYGKSLVNYPFSRAEQSPMVQPASLGGGAMAPMPPASSVGSPRPLAKIRFDKPNVDYEQPVYTAIQNALQQYPDARFELIAVHPTSGNPAQVAIESTRSRRDAERVLRTLTQMGISLDRIDLSYAPSNEARSSEVHLFLR